METNALARDGMIEEIVSFISSLKERRRKLEGCDEAATKQAVILPLLLKLGWDTGDTEEVTPEYGVENRRVDYSLRNENKGLIFLEVKRVSENLEKHLAQLLNYAFEKGVEIAVLTNGIEWWFYLPMLPRVDSRNRRFRRVNIAETPPEEAAEIFLAFMGKENVLSGKAVEVARREYEKQRIQTEIEKALPEAWSKVVEECHPLLVTAIAEKVKEICGEVPEENKIREFLKKMGTYPYGKHPPAYLEVAGEEPGPLPEQNKTSRRRIDALPQEAYYIPILETLVEMGGQGETKKIIETVGMKMRGIFSREDYEKLEDGGPRWKKRVAWALQSLRNMRLIENLERGRWVITEKGKRYLEEKRKEGLSEPSQGV